VNVHSLSIQVKAAPPTLLFIGGSLAYEGGGGKVEVEVGGDLLPLYILLPVTRSMVLIPD
jgi:hypothetical protein